MNRFEQIKQKNAENRRNLKCNGNYKAIINSIIEFYEDKDNTDTYEIYLNGEAIMDNKHLYMMCKNIDDKMIFKGSYEQVKSHNKQLKIDYDNLFRQNMRLIQQINSIDNEIRKNEIIQNLEKERFEASEKLSQKIIENSNLLQKNNELEKTIKQWQSMFTEQAMANAKLINK